MNGDDGSGAGSPKGYDPNMVNILGSKLSIPIHADSKMILLFVYFERQYARPSGSEDVKKKDEVKAEVTMAPQRGGGKKEKREERRRARQERKQAVQEVKAVVGQIETRTLLQDVFYILYGENKAVTNGGGTVVLSQIARLKVAQMRYGIKWASADYPVEDGKRFPKNGGASFQGPSGEIIEYRTDIPWAKMTLKKSDGRVEEVLATKVFIAR